MTDPGLRRLLDLCQDALGRTGAERDAFLNEACAGEPDVRRAVEALLAKQSETRGFLEEPAWTPRQRLAAGARLGPYEVQSFIGAGGMGEVYRARDTRLDRTVAIKVLLPAAASDEERRARFEREAKTIAALTHPHICILHDVGVQDGSMFLVMEYIAGETLAARLRRGPLPLPEALGVATQIADAVAAAHRQGISHRDLKPANVMLSNPLAGGQGAPDVKLLDFGLAKLSASEQATLSVTMASLAGPEPQTAAGKIVGTVPYMSPEQLGGNQTDTRSDIFSFGAVLYEMLTGRRAFDGDSAKSVITAILEREPAPLSSLQPQTPPPLDRIVRKCLAKDPDERWQSASDLAVEFRRLNSGSGAAVVTAVNRGLRRWWLAAAALVACAVGAVLTVRVLLSKPGPDVRLFDVRPADALSGTRPYDRSAARPTVTTIAISPDGQTIYFSAAKGEAIQIYARALDHGEATPIPGTEGGTNPLLSPDGRWIAFLAKSTWQKVPLGGGVPVAICPGSPDGGGAWGPDGRLLLGQPRGGVYAVDADGRTTAVTSLDREAGEIAHVLPQPLPGGSVIFTSASGSGLAGWKIKVWEAASGRVKTLVEGAADARYVATGHLVYVRAGKLCARPLDVRNLLMTGTEAGLEENVMQCLNDPAGIAETGASQVAISESGTLAFVRGGIFPEPSNVLAWLSRNGTITELRTEPHAYVGARLSADGAMAVAFTMGSLDPALWVHDIHRAMTRRVPAGIGAAWPLWAPDGKTLYFQGLVGGAGTRYMFRIPSDWPGMAERVPRTGWPGCWADGGRELVYVDNGDGTGRDIWAMPLDEPGKAYPLVQSRFNDMFPAVSPDGRWLAYASNQSGRSEVYLRAYRGGDTTRVSGDGGRAPTWSQGGDELFFVNLGGGPLAIYSVAVSPGPRLLVGPVTKVFEEGPGRSRFVMPPPVSRGYDVAPDGRFLLVLSREVPRDSPPREIEVVENWFDKLKARVPVPR